MNIPILITVFNRPDLFQQLIRQVKLIKPPKLYIACDGPRNEEDKILIDEIKSIIDTEIDWNVEIKQLFRETNLKSFRALPEAISWFFEHEEMGIILEDDCIPNESFFYYCETMLHKYKDDERVFSISGNNFQDGNVYGDGSYFLSRYFHVWGWASWRRAWKYFDINLTEYPAFKKSKKIYQIFDNKKACDRILQILDRAYKGKNVWDYKWQFAHLNNNGHTVKPQVNLVTNIGFDHRATHIDTNTRLQNLKVYSINKIIHSTSEFPYYPDADSFLAKNKLQPPNIWEMFIKGIRVFKIRFRRFTIIASNKI